MHQDFVTTARWPLARTRVGRIVRTLHRHRTTTRLASRQRLMDGLIIRFHDTLPETANGANTLHAETGFPIYTETWLRANAGQQTLSNIKSGGDLYRHGHGEPTKLGGLTTTEMAKFLADQGLKGPVVIHLYACNGG